MFMLTLISWAKPDIKPRRTNLLNEKYQLIFHQVEKMDQIAKIAATKSGVSVILNHTIIHAEEGDYDQYYGLRNGSGQYTWWTNLNVNAPTLSVLTMGLLNSGDSILLNGPSGNFTTWVIGSAVHDVVIAAKNGLVTFSGGNYADMGNSGSGLVNITVDGSTIAGVSYGIKFTNTSDAFLFTGTHSTGLRFRYLQFVNVPNNMFDVSGYAPTYNGTDATLKGQNWTLDHLSLTGCGELWQGTYGTIAQTNNLTDSITMSNIIISQTATNGTEVAAPISRINAHDWVNTYIGANNVTGDVGMFQIASSGTVNHILEYGNRGYVCRNLYFDLVAHRSDFYLYDCIGLASNAYGGTDQRADTTFTGSYNVLYGYDNVHIFNNTFGNKTDVNGYVCPVAIIGVMVPGEHFEIRNNLGFNNQYGANTIVNDNSNSKWTTIASDTSNNKYLTAAQSVIALADTNLYCNLASSSPLAASGVATVVTVDYKYRSLANPPPTGAEAFASALTPPTLTAAGGATVDNPFNITFTPTPSYNSAVTSVLINGTALPGSAWSLGSGTLTLTPSASSLLQTATTVTVTIIATGYTNNIISQAIGAGAVTQLSYSTQPQAPINNGGALAVQPVVHLLDQYSNQTTGTNNIIASATGATWTPGGTLTVAAISGVCTFTNITAATALFTPLTVTLTLTISGGASKVSNSFVIPANNPPGCNCVFVHAGYRRKYVSG